MLTLLIAASLTADDPVGADVRKALTAREQTLKGATWRFRVKQGSNTTAAPQGKATEGAVQLSNGAIAVETAEPKGRVRRIQSPTDEWTETALTVGKKVDVTKAKSKAVREDHAFKTAEMQGLAVAGRYGPLSKYLENAMVEKRPDGVVRFTVSETQRERATQRLEFDFESKEPFRLKEFRFFGDDDKSFEYFRNQEFGEAGGQWYAKQSAVGKSNAEGKAADPTGIIEIVEFQTTSTPIDLAKLDSSLSNRYASTGDPSGMATKAGKGGGFGGPQKGGAQKGGDEQKGGGQKGAVAQKGGGQQKGGGRQMGNSATPPAASGADSDVGRGRFDAGRLFAWPRVDRVPPIVQWILPATCAAAAVGLVIFLRRRPA